MHSGTELYPTTNHSSEIKTRKFKQNQSSIFNCSLFIQN